MMDRKQLRSGETGISRRGSLQGVGGTIAVAGLSGVEVANAR
jgi:hypothetical protein